MAKRLAAALLAAALGLGLTGCGAKEELPSRSEQAAFSAEVWEAERPQIAVTLTEPDIVETTFTHDDTGLAVARLLGQELIVYPRYAKLLQKGYADLPEEYRLLTALLNTDGTTLGITQGANTANARYVAGQIAGGSGRRQFITKEQVEYAAQALFGEEVEIAHQSVPVGAAPREQYRYYEEYGVYAYPEQQPIWYLPVLLDFWEVSFNTREAEIIFVRYADSGQNAFWGPGTEPIARWEIEEQANYNSSQYRRYTVTLKEMFGEWDIEEVLPAGS